MSLMRTKGHLYGRLELTAPFALEFPGNKGICLIVTRGSCLLGVDKNPLVPLVGGGFCFSAATENLLTPRQCQDEAVLGSGDYHARSIRPFAADYLWRGR